MDEYVKKCLSIGIYTYKKTDLSIDKSKDMSGSESPAKHFGGFYRKKSAVEA